MFIAASFSKFVIQIIPVEQYKYLRNIALFKPNSCNTITTRQYDYAHYLMPIATSAQCYNHWYYGQASFGP